MATIERQHRSNFFATVRGTVWRAVRSDRIATALDGSRGAARFSAPDQPTLYLSGTEAGVWAALHIANDEDRAAFSLLEIAVECSGILDLRDADACEAAHVDPSDAAADWRTALAAGLQPPSWDVRQRAEALDANGLVDPSRHAPGLWHLVLFRWNQPGAPHVRLIDR